MWELDKKRLIFFNGVFDTLDIFTFELEREFRRMGYETMLFDSGDTEGSTGVIEGLLDDVDEGVEDLTGTTTRASDESK